MLYSKNGDNDSYMLGKQRDKDGKDVLQARMIKDRDGSVLSGSRSVMGRWKEYLMKLKKMKSGRNDLWTRR